MNTFLIYNLIITAFYLMQVTYRQWLMAQSFKYYKMDTKS